MRIDFTSNYDGLLLIQPPMQFSICDGFNHYHIDLTNETLTESGECNCGKETDNNDRSPVFFEETEKENDHAR